MGITRTRRDETKRGSGQDKMGQDERRGGTGRNKMKDAMERDGTVSGHERDKTRWYGTARDGTGGETGRDGLRHERDRRG